MHPARCYAPFGGDSQSSSFCRGICSENSRRCPKIKAMLIFFSIAFFMEKSPFRNPGSRAASARIGSRAAFAVPHGSFRHVPVRFFDRPAAPIPYRDSLSKTQTAERSSRSVPGSAPVPCLLRKCGSRFWPDRTASRRRSVHTAWTSRCLRQPEARQVPNLPPPIR